LPAATCARHHLELGALGQKPVGAYLAAGWDEVGTVAAVRDDFAKLLNIPRDALNLVGNPPDWFREHRLLPPVRERAESLRLETGGATLLDIRRGTGGRWTFAAPERLAGSEVESERLEGHSLLGDFLGRIDELQVRASPTALRGAVGQACHRLDAGRSPAPGPRRPLPGGRRVLAVTTQRPGEGLELPPDVLDLFTPLQPELLRSLPAGRGCRALGAPRGRAAGRRRAARDPARAARRPVERRRRVDPAHGGRHGHAARPARPALAAGAPGARYDWRVLFAAADGSPLGECACAGRRRTSRRRCSACRAPCHRAPATTTWSSSCTATGSTASTSWAARSCASPQASPNTATRAAAPGARVLGDGARVGVALGGETRAASESRRVARQHGHARLRHDRPVVVQLVHHVHAAAALGVAGGQDSRVHVLAIEAAAAVPRETARDGC
jgi:hypothetical protein